ncbi:alpha/beta fold hydrolase [Echinimonas agarilytica]|uniref:Alpha/beta hydrolase n=1 Tax=Echinimonas agarilytica TaxID=1215918 RepID=A0AA42B895_9GAMM|nr:alpha/beta hydrolase [Echinimonas agarilytica]MCM2680664.1 alpha/beta hydrolase [Echinimonas agarilytica]
MTQRIVLLRGLLRDHRHWGSLPDMIRVELPDAIVETPDLAGNGLRSHETSPFSVEQMVNDIRLQLQPLQPRTRYTIVALSMGGMIGAQWAQMYPNEIGSLILMNSSFKRFSKMTERLNPQWYFRALMTFLLPYSRFKKEQLVLEMTSTRARFNQKIALRWTEYACEGSPSVFNALRQLWAAAHYSGSEEAPCDHVLILNGGADDLVSPKCSLAIAEHWNCELVIQPTAGHDLSIDAPDWVLQHIVDRVKPD